MILKQFEYKEFIDRPNIWSLSDFHFNDKVNLLVGRNATGKTRTIEKISALAGLLIGQQHLSLDYENLYLNVRNRNDSLKELLICLSGIISC